MKKPKHSKQPETIPFENNAGEVIQLSSTLTIEDLARMGITRVAILPHGTPLPKNWWQDQVGAPR